MFLSLTFSTHEGLWVSNNSWWAWHTLNLLLCVRVQWFVQHSVLCIGIGLNCTCCVHKTQKEVISFNTRSVEDPALEVTVLLTDTLWTFATLCQLLHHINVLGEGKGLPPPLHAPPLLSSFFVIFCGLGDTKDRTWYLMHDWQVLYPWTTQSRLVTGKPREEWAHPHGAFFVRCWEAGCLTGMTLKTPPLGNACSCCSRWKGQVSFLSVIVCNFCHNTVWLRAKNWFLLLFRVERYFG